MPLNPENEDICPVCQYKHFAPSINAPSVWTCRRDSCRTVLVTYWKGQEKIIRRATFEEKTYDVVSYMFRNTDDSIPDKTLISPIMPESMGGPPVKISHENKSKLEAVVRLQVEKEIYLFDQKCVRELIMRIIDENLHLMR